MKEDQINVQMQNVLICLIKSLILPTAYITHPISKSKYKCDPTSLTNIGYNKYVNYSH